MKFIRYRQNFASGYGQWEYRESDIDKEDFIESLHREYDWSDKYRGCDIEDIESPPKEWVERQSEYYKNKIKWAMASLGEYEEFLKTYE